MHYVGIDASSQTHSIQVIDSNGQRVKRFVVENNFSGFEKLEQNLRKFRRVSVGIEITHGPIIDFLSAKKRIIYAINPLKIKRFKETNNVSGDKTDALDAMAIAGFLRANIRILKPIMFSSSEVEQLKIYSISHDRLVQERARLTNRLIFILRQYNPLYESLFVKSAPKILLNLLLSYPTAKEWMSLSDAEIRFFLVKNNYRVGRYITRLIGKTRAYRHCISGTTENALKLEAQTIARMLLLVKEQISDLEKHMTAILDSHPMGKVFRSLPGAGDVIASKLLGLLGDNRDRFDSANGLQSLMGTAPMNYQSGSYHKVIMRCACNKRGRSLLFLFAFTSLNHSQWARKYYDGQRSKGKSHSVATRALSNKWLKIIYRIWSNVECYSEEKKLLVA